MVQKTISILPCCHTVAAYHSLPLTLPVLYHLNSNTSVIRQKGESRNRYFKKTKHVKFSEKQLFLTPWYVHVRVRIGGKKCSFFGKFDLLCFPETPVSKFAILPYYWRIMAEKDRCIYNKNYGLRLSPWNDVKKTNLWDERVVFHELLSWHIWTEMKLCSDNTLKSHSNQTGLWYLFFTVFIYCYVVILNLILGLQTSLKLLILLKK